MDKSRICVTRTINLAKKSPCVKKQNLLIYDKSCSKYNCDEVKPVGYVVPPISALPAIKIRVCTGKELKKICAPKLCECPPKKTIGFFGMITKIVGFGLKTALAAGLVYWSYEIGLWGGSDRTETIYKDFCHIVVSPVAPVPICTDSLLEEEDLGDFPTRAPTKESEFCKVSREFMCAKKKPDPSCSSSPHVEGMCHRMKEIWNSGIVFLFKNFSKFPNNIIQAITRMTTPKAKIDDCAPKTEEAH